MPPATAFTHHGPARPPPAAYPVTPAVTHTTPSAFPAHNPRPATRELQHSTLTMATAAPPDTKPAQPAAPTTTQKPDDKPVRHPHNAGALLESMQAMLNGAVSDAQANWPWSGDC